MQITPSHRLPQKRALKKKPDKPTLNTAVKDPPKKSGIWKSVTNGFDKVVRQAPMAASASTSLRIGSRQLRAYLDTGVTSAMGVAGMYVGLAAAALRVAGGSKKLVQAVKERKLSTALEGVKDFGSAALIGLASVGKFAARRIALPISGGFNTFRGAFYFASGLKNKDKARQSRGVQIAISSLGTTARALKSISPWFLVAGRALAPVSGFLTARKGIKTLASGLRKNSNVHELKGVVDITSAVGLTLLLSGLATMPGLAIFSTAQTVYSLYKMSPHVRKFIDPVIDKAEPVGLKTLDGIRGLKEEVKEAFQGLKKPFVWDGSTESEVRGQHDPWEIGLAAWPELEFPDEDVDPTTPEVEVGPVAEAEIEPEDDLDDDLYL